MANKILFFTLKIYKKLEEKNKEKKTKGFSISNIYNILALFTVSNKIVNTQSCLLNNIVRSFIRFVQSKIYKSLLFYIVYETQSTRSLYEGTV